MNEKAVRNLVESAERIEKLKNTTIGIIIKEENMIKDRIGKYLNEAGKIKMDIPKEFQDDPLYMNVIKAIQKQDMKEFKKAKDTLKQIRGSAAAQKIDKFIEDYKDKLKKGM